jgi:energy-coupling factor transport system ATP-binding protein
MIEITALRYRQLAIDRLSIGSGVTGIIGANGSGKTTFLRLLAGIILPESGDILIDGASPRETEAGWVNEYPDRNILFSRVFDEIASSLRFRHIPCPVIDAQVRAVAGAVKIDHLLERPVKGISGGEKALVAIASALVHRPGLLIMDEYDSHLDAARCAHIEDILRKSGIRYVIRCTQQMETAALFDHLIFMNNGHIAVSGTPGEVLGSLHDTSFFPPSWRLSL